jgi:hypothetical protein
LLSDVSGLLLERGHGSICLPLPTLGFVVPA